MTENKFIFDDDRPIPDDPKEQAPLDDALSRDEYVAVSAEQRLAMIAIEAAGARWLWRRARRMAFETAMQKAELLIGDVVCPHYQSDKRELKYYRRYMEELLRL